MTTPHPIRVDFVSDIVCPWCAVGLHSLLAAAKRVPEVRLDLHFHPFELNPQMGPEGEDLREHLQRKYGGGPAQFDQVHDMLRQRGAALGFDFSPARTRIVNTRDAHRLLHWAGLGRLPIVMADVNRAVAPGWNIWTDQNDTLAQRDTGWVQLYCENNQEVLDTTIQAFALAEKLSLPVMIVLDAFFLSHTSEPVDIPSAAEVDAFLPRRDAALKLDTRDPHAFGGDCGDCRGVAHPDQPVRGPERAGVRTFRGTARDADPRRRVGVVLVAGQSQPGAGAELRHRLGIQLAELGMAGFVDEIGRAQLVGHAALLARDVKQLSERGFSLAPGVSDAHDRRCPLWKSCHRSHGSLSVKRPLG